MRLTYALLILILLLPLEIFAKDTFQTLKIKNIKLLREKFAVKTRSKMMKNANIPIETITPLIDRVVNKMQDIYKKIGQEQSQEILDSGYELGVLNNPSFFWQLPFGEIRLSARRQVDPDLFHDTRYIVTDELIISVDAQKLLTNLKNEDIIELTPEFVGLYAGLEFRRVYRFSHFAENFVQGMTTQFEYLFFPFFYFRSHKINELSEYQFLERIDQLSAEVGGALNYQVPVYTGISLNAQAAFMYGHKNLTKVSMQIVGAQDQKVDNIDAKVNVSYEKEKRTEAGLSTLVQLEFIKFLKLTLLQYDYEFTNSDSSKIYLSFKGQDLNNSVAMQELDKLFIGASFNEGVFNPYRVQEETRVKQNLASKYTVLFWKGMNDKETERVQTLKNGLSKIYYKHTFTKTLFTQTFWQMVIPKLFLEIFNVGAINQYKELDQRIYHLEYESSEDLLKEKKDLSLSEIEEKISASFTIKYFSKTFKSANQRKVKMNTLLRAYAYVDSRINAWIDDGELIPPMDIMIKTTVNQNGILYFNQKNLETVKKDILWICNNEAKLKSSSFFSLSQISSEKEKCIRELEGAHKEYYQKLTDNDQTAIPISDFREMLSVFSRYFSSKTDIEKIFGKENVFMFGKFSAKTKDQKSFVHNFKHGELKSLGVIADNNIARSKEEIIEASSVDAQQEE